MPRQSKRTSRFLRLRRKNGDWRVDPRLGDLLLADADHDGSIAATINRILCDAYAVEYRPTGRPGVAEAGPEDINLKIQPELDEKLEQERLRLRRRGERVTVQDLILRSLARHYNLDGQPVAA